MGGAGQNPALVAQVALGHGDGGSGGRVEGGAGLEEVDDLAAALAGTLDHGVELFLSGPTELHEIGQGNTGHGGVAHQRHHVVAVAAEHEGGDVLHRDLELVGQEVAETRRVEDAGHAHDLLRWQARELLQGPDHRVERVGDADHEGVRRVGLDAGADRFHDFEVDADEVVAAHAGLARHAGGDDDHVGSGDGSVVAGARIMGIEAVDRGRLGDVETLALGHTVGDVEQDDVAEFLKASQMREGSADLSGADKRDLATCHGEQPPIRWTACGQGCRALASRISLAIRRGAVWRKRRAASSR